MPAVGEETLDTKRQKKGDTKEGYYIGREEPDAGKALRGPNQVCSSSWMETRMPAYAPSFYVSVMTTILLGDDVLSGQMRMCCRLGEKPWRRITRNWRR